MEAPSDNDFTTSDFNYMFDKTYLHHDVSEECLNLNTAPSETINLDSGEHPLEYPWVDFEGNCSQRTYSENCPYRKGEVKDDGFVVHKKFRLIEEFPDGLVYTGDSYGSHSYIDANEERTCPHSCWCRSHDQAPLTFTFVAHKSLSQLVVNIHSNTLYSEVSQVIGPEKMVEIGNIGKDDSSNFLDGFYLFQSFQSFQAHLCLLRDRVKVDQGLSIIISEMELLVYGFLADSEVFKSFGYEHLYENGILSYERWKAFQQEQLQRDISTLNERFIAIDDSEGLKGFTDSQCPASFTGILSDICKAAETQPDLTSTNLTETIQSIAKNSDLVQEPQSLEASPVPGLSLLQSVSVNQGLPRKVLLGTSGHMNWLAMNCWNLAGSNRLSIFDHIFLNSPHCLISSPFFGDYWRGSFSFRSRSGKCYNAYAGLVAQRGPYITRTVFDSDLLLIKAAVTGDTVEVTRTLDSFRAMNHHLNKTFWYLGEKSSSLMTDKILVRNESDNKEESEIDSDVDFEKEEELYEAAERLSRGVALAADDIALIEAVAAGHREVVEILLDYGASMEGATMIYDNNGKWTIEKRVPVVEAAEAGHGAVVRLLLQRGATVSSLEPLMPLSIKNKEDQTFRHLNKKLIQEHQLMTEATSDPSADFLQLGTRFKNHRETWNAGITTMRRLGNGRPPRGLQNAIAFLCISKAMAETLDSLNGSGYKRQFFEDLERWQVMFAPEELDVYRKWICTMWGVILSENKTESWKPSDFLTLTHFQTLISTLIRQDNEKSNICGSLDQSLISSQQQFIARNRQRSAELDIDLSDANPHSSDGNNIKAPNGIEPVPPDIFIAPEKIPLNECIDDDISAASLNATVILLMAGAIFAIVIIFFQWSRYLSTTLFPNVNIHDLQSRCQVLAAYLGLKTYFAMPSLFLTSTDAMDSIEFSTNTDHLQQTTKFPADLDSLKESPQSLFTDHSDQSMIDPTESKSIRQENVSSPCTIAVKRAPPSNYDTAMSSTDSSQESPHSQQSILTSNKIPQKPRSKCPICKKNILTMNLKRHLKDHTGENKIGCRFCGKLIGRKEYLKKHERDRCPRRHMNRQN